MEPEDPPAGSGQLPPVSAQGGVASRAIRLTDLDPAARRRALVRCGLTIVLSWVFVIGAFCVLPIGHESGLHAFVRLGLDIALIGAVFAWQIRRISVAELPELRAVEALGIVIVVFLVLFSGIYLAMSHDAPRTFTQTLDHIQALYFTISIFSTVGFGDITPRTDTARRPRLDPDVARPRHHRRRRPPHLQRRPEGSWLGASERRSSGAQRRSDGQASGGRTDGSGRHNPGGTGPTASQGPALHNERGRRDRERPHSADRVHRRTWPSDRVVLTPLRVAMRSLGRRSHRARLGTSWAPQVSAAARPGQGPAEHSGGPQRSGSTADALGAWPSFGPRRIPCPKCERRRASRLTRC